MTALSADPGGLKRWQGACVGDLIDHHAREAAGRTFLVFPETGDTCSFGQLRSQAVHFARSLAGLGIAPGESVAFAAPNGWGAALALLGCLYGGYRATPLNLVAGTDTLLHVLEHCETKVVLVADRCRELIREALAQIALPPRLIRLDVDGGVDWPVAPGALPRPPTAQAPGVLMYTSGTTGRPKGVLLSHANLIAGGYNTALAHRLEAGDRALCVLPLYHINGECVTVMGPLVSGGSVVMPGQFSTSRFWHYMADHRCTWFSVVPTLVTYLLHEPQENTPPPEALSSVRFGRSASAPLAPDMHRAFERRFGIALIETMGLTETAAPILSNPLPPGIRKYGSPGIAYGNEVIIADGNGKEAPRGMAGEILVRGPNVMAGYLHDREATSNAFTPDGWLRTGDLGIMDEQGYVYVTGRLKELIIKGGENIAPRDIDEALCAHPRVLEAAAFARPCERYGQRVEACAVLNPGPIISGAELREFCMARVGDFKAPDRVHIVTDIPKGPSGKIQRNRLGALID